MPDVLTCVECGASAMVELLCPDDTWRPYCRRCLMVRDREELERLLAGRTNRDARRRLAAAWSAGVAERRRPV